MEKPPLRKSAMARRRDQAPKKPPSCKAEARESHTLAVKHSESRRLPVAAAETDAGALDISIEFQVCKRGHRRRPRTDGGEPAPRVGRSAVLSQLKVRTQAALPTGSAGADPADAADGWTLVQVTRSSDRRNSSRRADATTTATSTVSVQRSEAPGAATARDAEPGGDTGDSGIAIGKRRRQRTSAAAGSRSVSQSLRELERISRRLLGREIPANTKAARAPSAGADKLARTRDHLLMLRSLTDNALILIGQYCQAPTVVAETPPQPFESLTFDSQQVQASEAGPTSTLGTLMAQTPRGAAAATPSAAVRCHISPEWHSAELLPASQWGQSERCACVIEDPHPEQRPSGQAGRSPRPVRGRTLRHSGPHPIVSWALCGDATAGRFPTVERRPVRIAAAAGPRPPVLPWLLARPLEMNELRWLSPELATSATSLPLAPITLYGICDVMHAAPLLLDRQVSQRLLAPRGGRCGAAPRWQAVPLATAVAWRRAEVAVVGLESSLVIMETATSSTQVTECHAASQYLRMAVLQMPQPAGARSLHPLIQPSELSTAVAKSGVFSCCWPTMSSGDDGGGGFSKSAAAPAAEPTGDAGGDKPDPSGADAAAGHPAADAQLQQQQKKASALM